MRSLVVVLVSVLLLAACRQPSPVQPATSPLSEPVSAQQVAFVQSMYTHAGESLQIADIALDPQARASQRVRDLAQQAVYQQIARYRQLAVWLRAWQEPVPSNGARVVGSINMTDWQRLRVAHGRSFDRLWLQDMVTHGQGAVDMAAQFQRVESDPDVRAFARDVAGEEMAMIDHLNSVLASEAPAA